MMSTAMFEYASSDAATPKDGLFLERLDAFMEKCLTDIRIFAERELRPYEETRRCIAQWHAKYLFQPSPPSDLTRDASDRSAQVRTVLCDTSHILESLSETSGIQSFLLAVDPLETSDGGFLGGSVIGREFWRGLRGGGDTGARTFKAHCISHLQSKSDNNASGAEHKLQSQPPSTPPPRGGPARSIKSELYETARSALRLASGVRGAEMKWTNPERLDVYGVRLTGWPEGVPAQNPSSLKVSHNKALLEALQNGTMKFERMFPSLRSVGSSGNVTEGEEDPNEDFSWAYDADAQPLVPPEVTTTPPSPSNKSHNLDPIASLPSTFMDQDHNSFTLNPTIGIVDPCLSGYDGNYPWGEDFGDTTIGVIDEGEEWDEAEAQRPKKRPRSETPSTAASAATCSPSVE